MEKKSNESQSICLQLYFLTIIWSDGDQKYNTFIHHGVVSPDAY